MKPVIQKTKKFVKDNSRNLVEVGLIAAVTTGAITTAYFIGKSKGAITLDITFVPRDMPPIKMPSSTIYR